MKFSYPNAEAIPEALKGEYEERDGAFVLKVTDLPEGFVIENLTALKGALSKERANNKTLVAHVAELEGERKTETHTLTGKVELLSQQNAKLLAALNEAKVRSACGEAIAAAKGMPALLMPVLEKRVAVESDVVVVKDEKGNTLLNPEGLPITVSEFVNTLRTRDEFGGAFLGTGNSGGGSPPSVGNGGTSTVTKPRSQMTVVEKAAYLKEHGTEKFMSLPA